MNWIKTADAVPQENGAYLCLLSIKPYLLEEGLVEEDGLIGSPDDWIFTICPYFNGDEGYFHHKLVCYKVTYWMPLPKMPDVIKKKEIEDG